MDEATRKHIADGFSALRQRLHHCEVNRAKWMQKAKSLEVELAKSEALVRQLQKEKANGMDKAGTVVDDLRSRLG